MLKTCITFLVFLLRQSQSLKPHHHPSNLLHWLHIPTLSISAHVFISRTGQLIPCLHVFHYSCVLPPLRLWNALSLNVIELLEKEQFRPKSRCPCFHSTFMPIHQKPFRYSFISSWKNFPRRFSCAKVAVSEEPTASLWKPGYKAPPLGKSWTERWLSVRMSQK